MLATIDFLEIMWNEVGSLCWQERICFPDKRVKLPENFPLLSHNYYYFYFCLTTTTTTTTTTTSVSQLFPADVSGNQIMENTRSLAGPWTRTQGVNACPGACGKLFFHSYSWLSDGQNVCQDGKKECPKSIPMTDKGGGGPYKGFWPKPDNALFIF